MPQPRHLAETPSLTATVPCQLVHRASVAETFLTGWSRTAADRFLVSAQWPRAHGLHVSADRSAYEPLLVVETVRQSGTLIAHTEYDVPLGHHFVLQEFEIDTFPPHLAVGAIPAEPVVEVAFTEVQYRGRRPVAARYTAEVTHGGDRVATARVAFSCTGESVYRRLRGGRTPDTVAGLPLPPALPAAVVGRALTEDVVLAPGDRPDRWRLRVDTAHPVFFDHPLDHVPGMLLLEAARQAVAARTPGARLPVSFRIAFHRYAELDQTTWIEVSDGGEGVVQVVGKQGDSAVFVCAVGAGES
ncbi:ScbA/BarX family gamma-butyrolactone biosynthesis protein [Streptomyces resistomycificus]|uniref:A-factor biosynthesis protein n=1 Tax=Streptomyces resistomycificus TaxID=67356 RepID=A0A0L8KPL7_9ACTN|nr:ScbA/BarX family gamma-butyrolactone biosynthesis protein [Streptomyces resistomycificus]KOG27888.1 A-factor biosynthesis protein [Streptomyces resistomycificus]KUO02283.1 A-factor biosynthesis protein [Streptomyces resistomycificus]